MGQPIQREYLRRLLRAVVNGDRTPEHATDVIISIINDNYAVKPEPITYDDEATKRHASNCHCQACESYREQFNCMTKDE